MSSLDFFFTQIRTSRRCTIAGDWWMSSKNLKGARCMQFIFGVCFQQNARYHAHSCVSIVEEMGVYSASFLLTWENRRGKIILLQVMAILSNKQLRLFIICAAGRYNISMFAVKRSHELFKPRPWYCQLPTLWDSLVLIDRTSPLFPWSPNTTTEDK